jgi:hypothetical protein
MTKVRWRLFCAALALAAPADARGQGSILLESYAGDPPPDAARYVSALVSSMGEAAPLHGAALRRQIEVRLSATPGPPALPEQMKDLVKRGRTEFIEGNFKRAIAKLERARSALLEHPALLATNQGLRDSLHMALLYLGHAYLRTTEGEKATERVSEVIRSFPDKELSLVRYGPELVRFYKKVRREMLQQPRGSLTVKTTPPSCMVFVNERYVGLSPISVENLHQGRYRVYTQTGRSRGRVYSVNVTGGGGQIQVDFELDRTLRTEPYVGFRFEDPDSMEGSEVSYAAAVARSLDASTAFLVGFRSHRGRRVLMGTVVNAATGRVVRSGMVALEPAEPSASTLGALGGFLVAGKSSQGVIIRSGGGVITHGVDPTAGGGSPAKPADEGPGFFSARVFKWITLGLAVGGLAAGVPLIVLDGRGTCDHDRCPDTYHTMTPGIALAAVGGAAAVTSGILFYLDARRERPGTAAAIAPQLLPGGGGITASVRF